MQTQLEVRRANEADVDAVAATLHAAFRTDPVSSWVFPDENDRERLHPGFMRMFVELAMTTGEVYLTPDAAAVAVWFPVSPDDHGDPGFVDRVAEFCGEYYASRFRALDQVMAKNHPAEAPHHYLNFIAVRPELQGKGLGTALLRHKITDLDAIGMPAYLEASSPRSVSLYAREGFVQRGSFNLPDGGPPMFPMWRSPAGR